jgi:gluconolactonase
MSIEGVEVLLENVGHPEGPDFLPDGRLIFVEGYRSRLLTWTRDGGAEEFVICGGKPYATCVGSDGWIYITQSGDVSGQWKAQHPAAPSIQRAAPDGSSVETVCTEVAGIELKRPNDLVFGPDGRLYFTDPGIYNRENHTDVGRVFALNPDGTGEVIAECGPNFPNGIAFEADGGLLWCESEAGRVMRRRTDGEIEVFVQLESPHHPEGMKVDTDGNVWITTFEGGGIWIVSADGTPQRFIETGGLPVNIAFGDGEAFVADFSPFEWKDPETNAYLRGRLLRIAADAVGLTPHRGSITPVAA